MSNAKLEERVAALERQLSELRTEVAKVSGAQKPDWRSTVGMFTGDEVMKRIDEHARRFREADRRKARQRNSKSRKVKA